MLLSMPQRKIVSKSTYEEQRSNLFRHLMLLISLIPISQIFTNADQAHAAKVLSRLGLEDCFEGVICFETLNPPPKTTELDDKLTATPAYNLPDDLNNHGFYSETDSITNTESNTTPHERILCKPSVEAMQTAIRIANIDPRRTVSHNLVIVF